MALIGFLILFPIAAAILLFIVRIDAARDAIVWVSGLLIAAASLVLVFSHIGLAETITFEFRSEAIDFLCTGISIAIVAIILGFCIRHKNVLAAVLALGQLAMALVLEFVFAPQIEVEIGLYYDALSLVMTFIIGVIGSAICIYALGYMKDFQAHEPKGARDRRPVFFGIMFLFLSAMFVIVFSNNMEWMFTGWEVTTVCSFLLIGYTKTEEAIRNAFLQIVMNLAGGIGFLFALYFCALDVQTFSFMDFIATGVANPALVALPVVGLSFAAITKAAQMPFQNWLLGAMVAPTPTSALLHSSTMVKAGVFLLVKLAPIFLVCPVPSIMVMAVGSITFLLCSFMAITQSNAKRVLAYSTIANLGLIVACAGVGTPEAVWAAIFLILFHAVAKSLLFMCVGTVEHHIGSRDIEEMDLLFERMPLMARFMMLGIMGMFIAPFGMLIAKWATLVSFVDTGQVALIIILGFGSAATFMFWAKWLGKLSGIAGNPDNIETTVRPSEWASLMTVVITLVICCLLLPMISTAYVVPYIFTVYQEIGQDLTSDNLWIASICVAIVVIVLFAGAGRPSRYRQVDPYLAGVGREFDDRSFQNSFSGLTEATSRNWYLQTTFGEQVMRPIGLVLCSVIIALGFICTLFGVPML